MLVESMQKPVGELKQLPPSLLAKLVVGQRIESLAVTSAAANELLKLKIQQTLFDIKTPWPIKQGQTVLLEVAKATNDKLTLNLIAPENAKLNTTTKSVQVQASALSQFKPLQIGQKIPVEVVSRPSNNVMVVSPLTTNPSIVALATLPKQIEVDTSRLIKTFQQGDKLSLQVTKLDPLSVNVADAVAKTNQQQRIVEQIKQLLPQQQIQAKTMTNLATVQSKVALPEQLTTSLTHLVKNIADSSTITQPDKLQQAIQNSGVFLERHLLQRSSLVDSDFKANLQRLIVNLQTVINQFNQQQVSSSNEQRNLPPAIQTALANIAVMPKELSKIPEHIRQTLASTGVKPAQLLTALLSPGSQIQLPEELRLIVEQQRQLNLNSQQQQTLPSRLVAVELVLLRELLREVESTANKIQLNQLGMSSDTDSVSASNVWMLDVPLKDKQRIDLIQMRIEQNKHNPFEQEGDIWQVDLGIDTDTLGPIKASISMHEHDVKVVLKAEQQSSSDLLEKHISLLQDNLQAIGVTVSYLSCLCEPSATDDSLQILKQQLVNSLVDISV